MFQVNVAGYLGADAETKNVNGNEFTTWRVAHSERWTDQQGVAHDTTMWVDCVMNGRPKVAEFLKKGTMVYCSGHGKLRAYSSEKARGFVAGCQISVQLIELLGGKSDPVPSKLYSADGRMHDVQKFYHTDAAGEVLTNGRGLSFAVDDNGWVLPMQDAPADVQQAAEQTTESATQEQTKTTKNNGTNK